MDEYENNRLEGMAEYTRRSAEFARAGIFSQQKLDGTTVIYKPEVGAPKAALEHYSTKGRERIFTPTPSPLKN